MDFFAEDDLDDELFLQADSMINVKETSGPPKFTVSNRTQPTAKTFTIANNKQNNTLGKYQFSKPTQKTGCSMNEQFNQRLKFIQNNSSNNNSNRIQNAIKAPQPPTKKNSPNATNHIPLQVIQTPQIIASPHFSTTKKRRTFQSKEKSPNNNTSTNTVNQNGAIVLPQTKNLANVPPPKIDPFCSKDWLYPINLPKREYQFKIVQTALYNNTLVCLPTGLGKTFIAGVVMYNYYRWFPESKFIHDDFNF